MKFLPREHGVTVIWFSSLLSVILFAPSYHSITRLFLFIVISIAILFAIGIVTRVSTTLIRFQRSLLLPLISSSLTLNTLIGYYLLIGSISIKILSVWILFFTYTLTNVSLIQRYIKKITNRKESVSLFFILMGIMLYLIEYTLFCLLGIINTSVIYSLMPLIIMWLYIRKVVNPNNSRATIYRIKRIGFLQTITMITFIIILAFFQ
ncbi:MAG TPA: hypothetical protein VIH27_01340 [Nitrososphaerales archaeon]